MTPELFSQYVDVILNALIPFCIIPLITACLFSIGGWFFSLGKSEKKKEDNCSEKK